MAVGTLVLMTDFVMLLAEVLVLNIVQITAHMAVKPLVTIPVLEHA